MPRPFSNGVESWAAILVEDPNAAIPDKLRFRVFEFLRHLYTAVSATGEWNACGRRVTREQLPDLLDAMDNLLETPLTD